MNNKLDSIDDIEILDDVDDQSVPNENIKRQVDETVRSQLNAFANHRPYNSTYATSRTTSNDVSPTEMAENGGKEVDEFNDYLYNNKYQEEPVVQPIVDDVDIKDEPEVFDVDEDIIVPTIPQPRSPMPEVAAEPVSEPVASTPIERTAPLEKTMTIPELEKTAVYPSGVIPLEKNEPVDDNDSAKKSKKALIFIIGLFVLLAIVIFVVLPLVNPV